MNMMNIWYFYQKIYDLFFVSFFYIINKYLITNVLVENENEYFAFKKRM